MQVKTRISYLESFQNENPTQCVLVQVSLKKGETFPKFKFAKNEFVETLDRFQVQGRSFTITDFCSIVRDGRWRLIGGFEVRLRYNLGA